MRIALVIGDWSHDGHNQTATCNIESNLTSAEIKEAYKKGTELIGFDLTKDVCHEYEDSSIPCEIVDKCAFAGIKMPPLQDIDERTNSHYFDDSQKGYIELYCEIVKLGNPNFTYTFDKDDIINIGGYGLFYF